MVALGVWLAFSFRRSEAKRGKLVFNLAASLAESGRHEDACFHYAVAANAGHEPELCRRRIRELWSSYGPFDFSEQLQKIKSESCRYESCGEGFYHITVSDIRRWVGETNNEKAT